MTNAKREQTLRTKDSAVCRVLSICDPHFAATSPPAFKADYLATLESNLKQVLEFARKKDVDAVIWGGDLFHRKDPSGNPLWLIARVIRLLAEFARSGKLRHAGIAGNHDLRYGSLEAGLYGSPLEIVLESGQLTLLDREELVLETADGYRTRLAGGSYYHGRAEHVRDLQRKGADHLIAAGHFWLGTETGQFFGEPLYGHEFFKDSETDTLIVGHHHEDHGIHQAYGKHFVAPGAITITGAHVHDLTRRPAAALIEVSRDKTEIHTVRPKTLPASELLDLEKHQQLKEEQREADAFIQSLAQTELTAPDSQEILAQLAPPSEVKARVQTYIEAAETRK